MTPAGRKPLVLGQSINLKGDITTNTWVGGRSAASLERSLGYAPGRLSAGWWVLVLKQRLSADDFRFSGTTLRSGGRYGLPADNPVADKLRPQVQDAMIGDYGADHVRKMREGMKFSYQGPDRVVKVVPAAGHSGTMAPSAQYPMGAGGGQWTLIRECTFLVAAQVNEHGIARTPTFAVFLGESAAYENRAKLEKYLREA